MAIATFPGEPTVRFLPTSWKAWQLPSVEAIQKDGSGWATLHEILVAGKVDFVTPLHELFVAGKINFVTSGRKACGLIGWCYRVSRWAID